MFPYCNVDSADLHGLGTHVGRCCVMDEVRLIEGRALWCVGIRSIRLRRELGYPTRFGSDSRAR